MAKLLLSCDQSVKFFQGEYYACSKERYDFYHRYLRIFENMRLVVRCEEETVFDESWVRLKKDRIEVVHIPNFSGPKQYFKVYAAVGKAIKNVTEGCDAAIIRLPSTIGQRVAHKVMKARIPYAVEIVYDASDGASNSKFLILKLLWKRINFDMRRITYGADGVSCVTEKYLQQHYFSQKSDAFVSNYSTLSLYKEFFTSPRKFPKKETFSIIHVASQVDCGIRKGHIQLIKILSILKARGRQVTLTFVGKDYHDGIRNLTDYAKRAGVIDQVRFTGQVNRKKLSDLLESSDLFVFPTAAEGLPRVIIEAMAKGMPCVISNVSGNPELVSEDMLSDYLDINNFVNKIESLIFNKYLYEKISRQNFKKSLSFEASILQNKRDDFYRKLKERIKI